jgi:arsenate reductase
VETRAAIASLSALAHEGRLAVFRLLVDAGPDGMAAGDIARATGALPNTLSGNLATLSGAGLITSRRDGRSVIYAAVFPEMRSLLEFLVDDCCGRRPEICAALPPPQSPAPRTNAAARSVVFLCPGDPARAMLAAALMNALGQGRFQAQAASATPGSPPDPHVQPLLRALEAPEADVLDVAQLTGAEGPEFAIAITIDEARAPAARPRWRGQPITVHWQIPDPTLEAGTPAERAAAFRETARLLRNRIELLLALPMEKLDRLSLHARMYEIGRPDEDLKS